MHKFDLVVITREENEKGGFDVVRRRYNAVNVKAVVAGVQGLIAKNQETGEIFDSEIFHGGIKIAALQRNDFYRAARGDDEALDRLEATQFYEAVVVRGKADVLDMTEAEFFALYPVKFTPLSDERAKSALGSMLLIGQFYSDFNDVEEVEDTDALLEHIESERYEEVFAL